MAKMDYKNVKVVISFVDEEPDVTRATKKDFLDMVELAIERRRENEEEGGTNEVYAL